MRQIRRYWFLLVLPLVLAAGWWWPESGRVVRKVPWALGALVASVMAISGYSMDWRRMLRQSTNFRAITLSVATTYLLAPLLAYALARWWGPPIEGAESVGSLFLQAVMLAAAQSTTLATAIALTKLAHGDEELALVLSVVSSVLTAVLTPLVLEYSIGAVVSFPVGAMMARITLVVVLPTLVGQGLRCLTARYGVLPSGLLRNSQQSFVLVVVYVAFSAASEHLRGRFHLAWRFLAIGICLQLALVAWSYMASRGLRFSAGARTAMIYACSQKSVPNGIYLWEAFFAANPFGAVPLVLNQLCHLAAGYVLVPWLERDGREEDEC